MHGVEGFWGCNEAGAAWAFFMSCAVSNIAGLDMHRGGGAASKDGACDYSVYRALPVFTHNVVTCSVGVDIP